MRDDLRPLVVEVAREWIGIPYRHQGRNHLGIDCVGLVIKVAHKLKLSDFEISNYPRRPDGDELLAHFDREMAAIERDEIRPGDVLLFAESLFPCHAAIVAERNRAPTIIHAYAKRRRVVEELFAHEWPSKAIRAYQFKDQSWRN